MKKIFISILWVLCTNFAQAQFYKIDSSFGVNGVKQLFISRELGGIAVQPNNNLVLCGYNNVPQTSNYQLAVNALTNTGQIDFNFGNQGNATTWFDTLTYAYDCAIQTDGKVVVVGTYSQGNTPQAPATFKAFVLRYLPNGTIDSSFGTNGLVLVNIGDECNFAKVKILPSGKIIAAGNTKNLGTMMYLLVQLNTNGSYDPTFGSNGIVTTWFPHEAGLWDLDILQDGSIIASGNEGPYDPSPNPTFDIQMCMIKYTSLGQVDNNFGTNGIVYLDIDPFTDDIIFNLHEQSDGKLITTGIGNNQGIIVRFHSNGTLDSTYDGDGIKNVGHKTRVSVLQSNDKLITTNNYLNAGGQDIKLVRYNSDASLDTTFGSNGNLNHNIPGTNNYIQNVTFDNLNNIIVCGSSDSGSVVTRYSLIGNGPSAIENAKTPIRNIRLYPNPVNNILYLEIENTVDENASICFVNSLGQVCYQNTKKLLKGKNILDLPTHSLVKGLYYLDIETNSKRFSTKFIKQ